MGGALFPPCYLPGVKLWWPGQNTGVGSLSLLQGSSQPRDQIQASCIAGRFFTSWATREALNYDGDNEDNGDFLLKAPWRHCYTQCPQPCSRPPPTQASHETPLSVWVSLLWGHCSFLLSPGAHNILFVSSKSLFLQSCVSTWTVNFQMLNLDLEKAEEPEIKSPTSIGSQKKQEMSR